jgi:hypothetical protein
MSDFKRDFNDEITECDYNIAQMNVWKYIRTYSKRRLVYLCSVIAEQFVDFAVNFFYFISNFLCVPLFPIVMFVDGLLEIKKAKKSVAYDEEFEKKFLNKEDKK